MNIPIPSTLRPARPSIAEGPTGGQGLRLAGAGAPVAVLLRLLRVHVGVLRVQGGRCVLPPVARAAGAAVRAAPGRQGRAAAAGPRRGSWGGAGQDVFLLLQGPGLV